jgi:hypothetical protein
VKMTDYWCKARNRFRGVKCECCYGVPVNYSEESHGDKGRTRHGSKEFYNLLQEMSELHDKKSHDYASNDNPFANYEFAGQMACMFSYSPQDAGFIGRLAEKIYRIKNLETQGKVAINESIEDTERDICVITALWIASRRERRLKEQNNIKKLREKMINDEWEEFANPALKTDQPNLEFVRGKDTEKG